MVTLKVVDNELVVSEIGKAMRGRYYLSATTFITFQLLIFYFGYYYNSVFYLGFLFIFIIYGSVLKRPANWNPVKIRVSGDAVFINKKEIKKEDLIFLSFHQKEECSTIRLEAKRNNIFRPNEARLISNCANDDEAIELCRVIRDFIDPALQICYIRLVKGKSESVGFTGKVSDLDDSIVFEKRYFID